MKHGTSEEISNSLTNIIKQNTHVNTYAPKKSILYFKKKKRVRTEYHGTREYTGTTQVW